MKKRWTAVLFGGVACGAVLFAAAGLGAKARYEGPALEMPSIRDVMNYLTNPSSLAVGMADAGVKYATGGQGIGDLALGAWQDYGNLVTTPTGAMSFTIAGVKQMPGVSGDSFIKTESTLGDIGMITNTLDTAAAWNQLTHPDANPYAEHPSLAFGYDVLVMSQAITNWVDKDWVKAGGGKWTELQIEGIKQALGFAGGTWADEETRTAMLDWANSSVMIGTLDLTIQNTNEGWTSSFENFYNWYYDADADWDAEEWRKKNYFDRLNFYAQMVQEGREKEYEWLRDDLLARAPKAGAAVLPKTVTAKKPNIYLYPEKEMQIQVTFGEPEHLITSIPAYGEGYQVTAEPDGTLYTADGSRYEYLFYESFVEKTEFQQEEGFLIKAEERKARLEEILECYGYSPKEIQDFTEYWQEALKPELDYVMYPMETEKVNEVMPIDFSEEPDSLYRIWFGFVPDRGEAVKEPEVTPILREGFTVVEWGGAIF